MPLLASGALALAALGNTALGQCGDPLSGPCCAPHGFGGCTETGCCVTVGNVDFSCLVEWDSVCAALAAELCGKLCFYDYLP